MTTTALTDGVDVGQHDPAAVAAEETRAPFDAAAHLINIGGRNGKPGWYLEVRWRLVWLRREHPDAHITTELIQGGPLDNYSLFKATVTIPGGGSATGWKQETAKDFADHVEKAECCEGATEILTREGFKRHDELIVGEEVLAYDLATDRCVWTPLRRVVVYDDAPVVRLGGKWFSAIVTQNHSWATAGTYLSCRTGESPRRLRETKELKTSDRLILSAPAPGGESDITPDEAAILGWMFTDGSVWSPSGTMRAKITQSKPDRVVRIRELVGAGARETVSAPTVRTFPTGNTYSCLPHHRFALPAKTIRPLLERAGLSSSEDLPALIPHLSQPARAAMYAAMMQADGDTRGYFGKLRKPGVFEAWRILATLEGLAVGPVRNAEVFPVQRAKLRRYVSMQGMTVTDAGRAKVWCPTTDFGTWVAKLPTGQITITGNTGSIGRALAALGYGTQFCDDHDLAGNGAINHQEGRSQSSGQPRIADAPVDFTRRNSAQPSPPAPPSSRQSNAADAAMSLITERQVKFSWALARECGMNDQDMTDWCRELFGQPEVEKLNRRDASALVEALQRRRQEVR